MTAALRNDLPSLPFDSWKDTQATLHMWTQIVGKIRLKLCPLVNHYWNVTLYLTARGMTTGPMPYGERTLEICFDFIDHELQIATSDGRRVALKLKPQSVASFYRELMATLADLGMPVKVWTRPQELPPEQTIPFEKDEQHASYDAAAAHNAWLILAWADTILKQFRTPFMGKVSPIHFFWGSFDLAVTRFSGRPAPPRPDADPITREAYSHEVSSAGFWFGGGPISSPAFYSYAAPEPPGFAGATVSPPAAFYNTELKNFLLMYDDVRTVEAPEHLLLDFFQSTYEAAANLGSWDRRALERQART
jgi:hypothetical protein